MKRSILITLIAVIMIGVAGALWVKNYYDSRYVGQDYYTVVPADEPVALGDLLDSEGNPADTGYSYELVGYDTDLNRRVLEFDMRADSDDGLYQPGTYLKVSASKQIVLNEAVINESEVPTEILEKLNSEA